MDSDHLLQWVYDLYSRATNVTKRSQSDEHFQRYPDVTTLSEGHD